MQKTGDREQFSPQPLALATSCLSLSASALPGPDTSSPFDTSISCIPSPLSVSVLLHP